MDLLGIINFHIYYKIIDKSNSYGAIFVLDLFPLLDEANYIIIQNEPNVLWRCSFIDF